jgi:hypothetical protein
MRIQNIDSFSVTPGLNPDLEDSVEVLKGEPSNPGVTSTVNLNPDGTTQVEIEEFTTPSGSKAIRFVSPVSGEIVEILKPTTLKNLEIEKYLKKKHSEAGYFEQILVNLSFLVCRYGDKVGDRVMTFKALAEIEETNEILALSAICNQFFRLGQL